MTALERIQQEVEQWFLTEPLFFTVYCSHRLTINPNMKCALRSGKGRIEYNPELIAPMSDHLLRALLRVEMVRILLKHPYSRQPLGCPGIALKMASDMVIAPAYRLSWAGLTHPNDLGLPVGKHFEWYANRLSTMGIHMDGSAPSEGDSCADGEKGEGSAAASPDSSEEKDEKSAGNSGNSQEEGSMMGIPMDGSAPSEGDSCADGEKGEGSAAASPDSSEEKDEKSAGNSGNSHEEGMEQEENTEEASSCGADSEEKDKKSAATEGQQGMSPSGRQEDPSGDGASLLPEDSETSDEQGNVGPSQDYTSLWEEDAFMGQQITDIIQSTTQWGSLPGGMVELIQKAAEGRIDYRNALRAFRSSILSQKRHLTRMYPSRRFGFEQMGSRYEFTTRLLVAIDTSGSVGSEELGRYFRIITTFFKYGIQEIDVLMFDTDVQGEPVTLKEAQKNKQSFEVKGRGGTNFQAPIDYVANHPDYDGLIIMTDGYAAVPSVPAFLKTKLLWVIDNEPSYKQHYDALRKTGRVCLIEL